MVVDHRQVVRRQGEVRVDDGNEHGVDDLGLIVEYEALGHDRRRRVVRHVDERRVRNVELSDEGGKLST